MSAVTTPQVGTRVGQAAVGRYRLLRFLGAGGMGEVYEAEHLAVGKRVALKCMLSAYWGDAEQVERFEREARVASMVRSPHVVDVLDAGKLDDGAPFFVMELLEGTSLAAELAQAGRLPPDRAVGIARQLATGLGAAHAAGIIHRDLKPENVYLSTGTGAELVKILDFGVSKFRRDDVGHELTRTGASIGTPTYMSPEQTEGMRDVDARADVWSLGVILFRMLTGELPFQAENWARLIALLLSDEPAPRVRQRRPDVSRDLDAIVARCLEKAPAGRFASMAELLAALPTASGPVARREPAPRADAAPPPADEVATRLGGGGHVADPSPAPSYEPTQVARPPTPVMTPARASAPPPARRPTAQLPFDEVLLEERGSQRRLPAGAFFALPLSERIRHVIARTVTFLDHGIEVDRQEALAKMRERSVS